MTMTIEDLAARVAALEADRCTCASCFERARQRADEEFAERALAIRRLPVAERIAALKALDTGTMYRVIGRFDRETHVETALAAPEFREQVLQHADRIVKDIVEANLRADDGTLPRFVRVTNKTGDRDRFREREIKVDDATADALTEAGFHVRSSTSVDDVSSGKIRRRTVNRFSSPAIDIWREFTPDQWRLILGADEVVRAAMEAGDLTVHEPAREELIKRWLDDPHRHTGDDDRLANFRRVSEGELHRSRVEKEFLR